MFYFSLNGLNFDFLTPYIKDNLDNIIMKNGENNYKSQFSELFYESTSRVTYNEQNSKGNTSSNYKHPFIKNFGNK